MMDSKRQGSQVKCKGKFNFRGLASASDAQQYEKYAKL